MTTSMDPAAVRQASAAAADDATETGQYTTVFEAELSTAYPSLAGTQSLTALQNSATAWGTVLGRLQADQQRQSDNLATCADNQSRADTNIADRFHAVHSHRAE
ncbi:hypothetical protein ACFYNO_08440 [Kitasatospora sp. NPDC006697]|uniref:hypothetical protein n=1 Tax=Kitasatospora sp. NPDC006697 TaxID=3364020 RepID=UPI0036821ADE